MLKKKKNVSHFIFFKNMRRENHMREEMRDNYIFVRPNKRDNVPLTTYMFVVQRVLKGYGKSIGKCPVFIPFWLSVVRNICMYVSEQIPHNISRASFANNVRITILFVTSDCACELNTAANVRQYMYVGMQLTVHVFQFLVPDCWEWGSVRVW
jgi:hypothetical protein